MREGVRKVELVDPDGGEGGRGGGREGRGAGQRAEWEGEERVSVIVALIGVLNGG